MAQLIELAGTGDYQQLRLTYPNAGVTRFK
jgi:hypothetical protein